MSEDSDRKNDLVPVRYVVWWLLIAFLLGTQWRMLLASFVAH